MHSIFQAGPSTARRRSRTARPSGFSLLGFLPRILEGLSVHSWLAAAPVPVRVPGRSWRAGLVFALAPAFASVAAAQELPERAPGGPGMRAAGLGTERPPAPRRPPAPDFALDEVLVRFAGGLAPGDPRLEAFDATRGLARIDYLDRIGVHRYRLPDGTSLAEAIRGLRSEPLVESVEPNRIYRIDAVPNDPMYDDRTAGAPYDWQRWYFAGVGGGDPSLRAEEAWDITTGRDDVVIAVIDSGIDLDHPDLAANIWKNPGEVPGNGIDDDANGFVDDVNGWDFDSDDADPEPDLGDGIDNDGKSGADSNTFHGTFAASCASSVSNDGTGVAGASWGCRLMSLKVFSDDGGAWTSDIAQAVTYAADMGVEVINMSLGGGFSSTLQAAVAYAHAQGVVTVASAGNGNSPSVQYPAGYAHVVAVGASDSASIGAGGSGDLDGRASFTQYGSSAVDVVAPGSALVQAAVRSVADGNAGDPTWYIASGTSFSGPLVAGLAALVISRARDLGVPLTNDDVEAILQSTAADLPDDPNDSPDGGPDWDHHGRVDFLAALQAVDALDQPPVADAGADAAGVAGFLVTFDGGGSFDPDGDPIDWSWDFGDGSDPESGETVEHVFSSAGTFTVTLTVCDGTLTDADTAEVTVNDGPDGLTVYLSTRGGPTFAGLGRVRPTDIVALDPGTDAVTLVFDGSDVGLRRVQIDALCFLPDGDLLLSLHKPFDVPGLLGGPDGERIDDSDLVRFTPSSLGPATSGVFTFHFDGSDVGLERGGEDLDAVSLDPLGRLVVSGVGTVNGSGISRARDEDLLLFHATSLGATTAGTFETLFDGSDVGLNSNRFEDVDAAHVGPDGRFYFSTFGSFSASGVEGADEDLVRFVPTRTGRRTQGVLSLFLDGSAHGIPAKGDITGVHLEE